MKDDHREQNELTLSYSASNLARTLATKLLGMSMIIFIKGKLHAIHFKWGCFAPVFGLNFYLNSGGYFDNQYSITFCFGWGQFNILLPFRTKREPDSEFPQYGIVFHDGAFYLYYGMRYYHWRLPYFTWDFDRQEILINPYKWVTIDSCEDKTDFDVFKETHPYTYTLKNGEVQLRTATLTRVRIMWKRKWFPFLRKVRDYIDVEFDQGVGESVGSWKGGTIACSYDILPNETMVSCLRRMERERTFN